MSTASHAFVDQLQSRYWCITWNNPTVAGEELEKHLAGNPNIKEFAFQLEKGESGTKHFQIYVAYTTNQRGKRMRETWPGCHIDIRRGKREQAIAYCSQDEYEGVSKGRIEGPWIKLSQEQGKRNDLLAVKEKLDKGADMIDVAKEHFGEWVKHYRAFEKYQTMLIPKRDWKTVNVCIIGNPGDGKTRYVQDLCKAQGIDLFVASVPEKRGGKAWFDGYKGQTHVLMDDYRGEYELSFFLRLIDRYPMQVEVKNSHTQWAPKYIYFTTNVVPWKWYNKTLLEYDIKDVSDHETHAVMRRFEKIYEVKDGKLVEIPNKWVTAPKPPLELAIEEKMVNSTSI